MDKLKSGKEEFLIDWEAYRHMFLEKRVPARTLLLREGEVAPSAYFIPKGSIRLWFNNNGKDLSFQFFSRTRARHPSKAFGPASRVCSI
jgi:hypothetical protein